MKKIVLSTILAVCLLTFAKAQTGWTPATMIAYKRVTNPVISPDGKLVAYVVGSARMDADNSDFLTHIHLANADGKQNYQFTFGDKSCAKPQFSPDGQFLSFTSTRGKDGKSQLHLLRLTGGDAEPITTQKNSIGDYAWSPDSRRIAFSTTDARADEKERKEKKDWDVVDEFQNAHLYALTLKKDGKGTYPVKQLTKGAFHIAGFDWSPDGRTLAFTRQNTPSANAWTTSTIATVSADSGAVSVLVTEKGATSQPTYSPDGKWLAYDSDGGKTSWMRQDNVYVMPVQGGGVVKRLAATPDENPTIVGWSPDSRSVVG